MSCKPSNYSYNRRVRTLAGRLAIDPIEKSLEHEREGEQSAARNLREFGPAEKILFLSADVISSKLLRSPFLCGDVYYGTRQHRSSRRLRVSSGENRAPDSPRESVRCLPETHARDRSRPPRNRSLRPRRASDRSARATKNSLAARSPGGAC